MEEITYYTIGELRDPIEHGGMVYGHTIWLNTCDSEGRVTKRKIDELPGKSERYTMSRLDMILREENEDRKLRAAKRSDG